MVAQIVDISMNEIMNPNEVYSGMYARVSIRFFPYFNAGKKGIGCGLGNVQKLEDGELLGGRINAADDFGGGGYNPQVPTYMQQPIQTGQGKQPIYSQQPTYQQPATQLIYQGQQVQLDPITGAPVNGGVMGI
jgi:hypothetical protein